MTNHIEAKTNRIFRSTQYCLLYLIRELDGTGLPKRCHVRATLFCSCTFMASAMKADLPDICRITSSSAIARESDRATVAPRSFTSNLPREFGAEVLKCAFQLYIQSTLPLLKKILPASASSFVSFVISSLSISQVETEFSNSINEIIELFKPIHQAVLEVA